MENSKKLNRILTKEAKMALAVLLCFASIMALMPFSMVALGQTTSTVSGSIPNSSGAGLSNVAVELRTTGGLVLGTSRPIQKGERL